MKELEDNSVLSWRKRIVIKSQIPRYYVPLGCFRHTQGTEKLDCRYWQRLHHVSNSALDSESFYRPPSFHSIMSSTGGPRSIGIEDPVYYTELLKGISSPVDRRLPSNERSCLRIPGIQSVDDTDTLAQRLQTILDDIAVISLTEKGNVSATAARVKNDQGALETQLYIIFNHQKDEAPNHCVQHLTSIFTMLRNVPHKLPTLAMEGSLKLIAGELEEYLIEICRAIHNYSFSIFAHRVNKRQRAMAKIQEYIEKDQTYFTPEQRSTLLKFLNHVDLIIKTVTQAQATKQLSTTKIQMLISIYSSWKKHNLLPRDTLADNNFTLLDTADKFLDGE